MYLRGIQWNFTAHLTDDETKTINQAVLKVARQGGGKVSWL